MIKQCPACASDAVHTALYGQTGMFYDYCRNCMWKSQPYQRSEVQPNHIDSEGDPQYLGLLDRLRELHLAKAADYGNGDDPIANLRASKALGIPPWVGCILRMSDKLTRVHSLIRNGSLKNEPITDNLLDMAAYCLLALRLYDEESK